ncbi:MAG: hypothetical protein Q7T01_02955 [bacterium]|nr:hypothetical protein [bacterium]
MSDQDRANGSGGDVRNDFDQWFWDVCLPNAMDAKHGADTEPYDADDTYSWGDDLYPWEQEQEDAAQDEADTIYYDELQADLDNMDEWLREEDERRQRDEEDRNEFFIFARQHRLPAPLRTQFFTCLDGEQCAGMSGDVYRRSARNRSWDRYQRDCKDKTLRSWKRYRERQWWRFPSRAWMRHHPGLDEWPNV